METRNLTAGSSANGEVVGITLDHAAELLGPSLFPESGRSSKKGANKHVN